MEARHSSIADGFHKTTMLELVFGLHKTLSHIAGELLKLEFDPNKRDSLTTTGFNSTNFLFSKNVESPFFNYKLYATYSEYSLPSRYRNSTYLLN